MYLTSKASAVIGMLLLFTGVVSAPTAGAQTPDMIAYQGFLQDGGTPVSANDATVKFDLFAAESGGTAVWTETQTNVLVASGQFSVYLGSVSSLSAIAFDTPYWLEITYNGTTLTPRVRLAAVPYARRAATAATASAAPWSGLTGVPTGFSDGTDDIGGARRNCAQYVFPYMPYNSSSSQILYVARVDPSALSSGTPTAASDVSVRAVDDTGTFYNLGTVATLTDGPLSIAASISAALGSAGFDMNSKLSISIEVANPEYVFAYGSYTAGSSRAYVEAECIR